MTDLFMTRDAIISECGFYRYWLTRVWDPGKPRLVVTMLNPSTADASRDDPTILALIHFAKLWGYGGLIVINLKAFRTSKPEELFASEAIGIDIAGPYNRAHWRNAIAYARADGSPILVAWGNNARPADTQPFHELCGDTPRIMFGLTGQGQPIHPAARGKHRIARDAQPQAYEGNA